MFSCFWKISRLPATNYLNGSAYFGKMGKIDLAMEAIKYAVNIRETLVFEKGFSELKPGLASAYHNLALAKLEKRNYREALELRNRVIDIRKAS